MFILLNGAFGIGKTTTARALLDQMSSSRPYDPEPLGVALQRASAFLRPGGRIDDFQDLALSRRMTVLGARWRYCGGGVVIVPITFSNLGYLDALEDVRTIAGVVRRLCLLAPLDVVHERLRRRAKTEGMPVDEWWLGQAKACCQAHRSPASGHPVDATAPTDDIVRSIRALTGVT